MTTNSLSANGVADSNDEADQWLMWRNSNEENEPVTP